MNRNRKRKSNKIKVDSSLMIRHNTATLYGIYFATSNTDFLLKEKKTRFSVRPSVILNEDRKTVIFDYSAVKGTDESSIFDGFFRGISVGVTLTVDGGIETTCNFINEITGVPITNFADTYTIVKTDVDKKIIIATKETGISSTTAVVFPGNHFINLPQFTKTTVSESSTPIRKILNLLPSQSLSHLGIMSGSILEFKKTSKNNNRFTVKSIYTENGIECIEVEEPITQAGDCCPCLDCLYAAIREQESGGEANDGCNSQATDCKDCCPGEGDQDRDGRISKQERFLCGVVKMGEKFDSNCDGIKDCLPGDPCDRRTTPAQGVNDSCDCGPYQISWRGFVNNSCGEVGPCSNGDGGYDNSCCELCQPGYGEMLCKPCPSPEYPDFNVCCAEKKRRSEKLMDCNWRRFNRNPPRNCPCTGNYENEYPGERLRCCTCEDMARSHNGGPCRGSTDDYWRDIKARMDRLCPNCRTNGNTPPVKEAPSVRPGRR